MFLLDLTPIAVFSPDDDEDFTVELIAGGAVMLVLAIGIAVAVVCNDRCTKAIRCVDIFICLLSFFYGAVSFVTCSISFYVCAFVP